MPLTRGGMARILLDALAPKVWISGASGSQDQGWILKEANLHSSPSDNKPLSIDYDEDDTPIGGEFATVSVAVTSNPILGKVLIPVTIPSSANTLRAIELIYKKSERNTSPVYDLSDDITTFYERVPSFDLTNNALELKININIRRK